MTSKTKIIYYQLVCNKEMGFFLEKKVCLSVDNTSLAGREETCLNFEKGIPSELRETCWLVLVGELCCSCRSTPASHSMHTHKYSEWCIGVFSHIEFDVLVQIIWPFLMLNLYGSILRTVSLVHWSLTRCISILFCILIKLSESWSLYLCKQCCMDLSCLLPSVQDFWNWISQKTPKSVSNLWLRKLCWSLG